ncbi:MAG: UPF0280 family protein [Armatimonadetes bacterium]|nr:UPF0280 family protein [Armatimonadota bacterium]
MPGPRGSVYQARSYRRLVQPEGLVRFGVTVGESDLAVWAQSDLRQQASQVLQTARAELQAYLRRDADFGASLEPVSPLPGAPELVRRMARAARAAGVGPMAAVAGAVAQMVAEALEPLSAEVLVENGGDVYLLSQRERHVVVIAPGSGLSGRFALRVPAGMRMGVCTSSGKHGHSLSFGSADAAVVASADGALADAAATALGNRVRQAGDLEAALNWVRSIDGVVHAMVFFAGQMGAVGNLEIVPTRIHDDG